MPARHKSAPAEAPTQGTPVAVLCAVSFPDVVMRHRFALVFVSILFIARCRDAIQPVAPVADVVGDVANTADLAYLWVPLETRGENFVSVARAVNNRRQAVGSASTTDVLPPESSHAALWENGVMHDLGTLGGARSEATEINERGQVVGWSDAPDATIHGFFWDGGSLQDLGPIARFGMPGVSWATFYAGPWSPLHINARGQVVGNRPGDGGSGFADAGGGTFLWEDGVTQPLPLDFVSDINNRGEVAGWVMRPDTSGALKRRAAVWREGVLTELGTLGGDESWAVAISNSGWVTGSSRTEPRFYTGSMTPHVIPFRWRDGVLEDPGRVANETEWLAQFVSDQGLISAGHRVFCGTWVWAQAPWQSIEPSSCTWAFAMNGAGAITGAKGSLSVGSAFVWRDGVMHDLAVPGRASRGHALSANGVVAGQTLTGSSSRPQAAMWVPTALAVPVVP